MRAVEPSFTVDWRRLGPVLAEAAALEVDDLARVVYRGMNVYGSYDPANEADVKLHHWATNTVARFPGVTVTMLERQPKRRAPTCPECHEAVEQCPRCQGDMRGTEEKGVDVIMATDMVGLAWEGNYDIAVLVSSDRDFVPAAQYLAMRGIQVVHGAFPPSGTQLSNVCWSRIDVRSLRRRYQRART